MKHLLRPVSAIRNGAGTTESGTVARKTADSTPMGSSQPSDSGLLERLPRAFLEGFVTTRLLRNRGRVRRLYSWLLTMQMLRKLRLVKQGLVVLPSHGPKDSPPISLTSWPPRYNSLPLVLINVLSQDLLP